MECLLIATGTLVVGFLVGLFVRPSLQSDITALEQRVSNAESHLATVSANVREKL